jgi:Mn-dependent DtxR family transcriptional regulator
MTMIRDISAEGLRALVDDVVDERLREYLGDPDEGHTVRPEVQERLMKSLRQPRKTRHTVCAAEAARRLGIDL